MKRYRFNMLDQEEKLRLAEANKHIATDEVLKDIADTEAEIVQMTEEAEHLEKTPYSLPQARLDHMKALARRDGIQERLKFIERLKAILEVREDSKIA